MYPLNMTLTDGQGYAVANDEAEHKALTACGYGPAYQEPEKEEEPADEIDALRAELDAKGISYNKRMGAKKLKALLE